ncbi:uncharacterized protein LOC123270136 [Cotesia glomerata]|uniref:uncharacterized protein LOC123270136 n=1 Tax=Cotesia glomerata TaxID=32391 RepID=UPI001D01FBC0|nr:uncharacterized protein LOC123270136 [Cotesia glomerata]
MIPYATVNKGYKYLLTIIDIFSKYAWAVLIKSKSGVDVTSAMKFVLQQGCVPRNLHVDQGKEFFYIEFKDLMKQHKINLYSTFSNLKASICERFNRTRKNKMWREFTARGSYKWTDILEDLVNIYNNTKHSTIKMKSADVTTAQEKQLLEKIYQQIQPASKKKKINLKYVTRFESASIKIYLRKDVHQTGRLRFLPSRLFRIQVQQQTRLWTTRINQYKADFMKRNSAKSNIQMYT